MRARHDDGKELNADFAVETDGASLSLVLESAGGRIAGAVGSRNSDYVPALTLLLRRLHDRRAMLVSAFVASARVSDLPEGERLLVEGPLDLAAVDDIERLRLDITRAQGRIGLPEGAAKEGNNRKRIQLRLAVPGYGPSDAARLAADLAEPQAALSADDLLRDLVGVEIRTATGRPNTVLGVRGDKVLVRTDRSPSGRWVEIDEVQHGLDLLTARGTVRVTVDELGHRSAFVGAVLATLPGTQVSANPAQVTIRMPTSTEVADDIHFGELDGVAQVKVRTEQARLRKLLAGERESAHCALCGDEYPLGFLVAAHIKKRAVCTDAERRDLRNIAMLPCSFGCDALYESGWITVDEDGNARGALPYAGLPDGMLRQRLQHLDGKRCAAYRPASEPYFAWHRTTAFRGDSDQLTDELSGPEEGRRGGISNLRWPV